MFELERICDENLYHYNKYQAAFDSELRKYQSRIYPSEEAQYLSWYHIKMDSDYIGAVWLERALEDDFSVIGIFIADKKFRNKGIGKSVIEQVIENDLQYMHTNKILLRVREENERAIKCYEKVGFRENRRYIKNDLNVIEMTYKKRIAR